MCTHSFTNVVSNTIRPAAGVAIAFFCVVVMRGGRKPLVVDVISSIADALIDVLTPTPTLPLVVPNRTSPVAVSIALIVFQDCSGLKLLSWGDGTVCKGIASELIGCMILHRHGRRLETLFSFNIVEVILCWELGAFNILKRRQLFH